MDREEHPELQVAVRVADAGGLAATHIITVIIDDINDNPMKPASKTVYLWKTQVSYSLFLCEPRLYLFAIF